MDKNKITPAGYEELKNKLEKRIAKREKLINTIDEMRSAGDLSENDGFTLALKNHEDNEVRIAELEEKIETAVVVSQDDNGVIDMGSKVTVKVNDDKKVFEIVGESESDPLENKISLTSPIGSALKGKKAGDVVEVKLPKTTVEYEIIKVE